MIEKYKNIVYLTACIVASILAILLIMLDTGNHHSPVFSFLGVPLLFIASVMFVQVTPTKRLLIYVIAPAFIFFVVGYYFIKELTIGIDYEGLVQIALIIPAIGLTVGAVIRFIYLILLPYPTLKRRLGISLIAMTIIASIYYSWPLLRYILIHKG